MMARKFFAVLFLVIVAVIAGRFGERDMAAQAAEAEGRRDKVADNEHGRTVSRPLRLDAEARLSELEKNPGRARRDLMRSRLDAAGCLFPLRELTKNYLMMEYELLRGPLVELVGRLGLDGGIFYLHCDEIRWTAVTGIVTVKPPRGKRKPGPDGKIRIYIFIYTKAYGELWIDDVTLTPVARPSQRMREENSHPISYSKSTYY